MDKIAKPGASEHAAEEILTLLGSKVRKSPLGRIFGVGKAVIREIFTEISRPLSLVKTGKGTHP